MWPIVVRYAMFEVTAEQEKLVLEHLTRCRHCADGVSRITRELEHQNAKPAAVSKDQELIYKI